MVTYHIEYAGYYVMQRHDMETNKLVRWFNNYKLGRWDLFANDTEFLVVKEVPSNIKRGGIRYVCEITDEGRGTKREVIMDHTAPTPPWVFFAAKHRYEPPPPKTAKQLREEAEYERMYRLGYEPRRRVKRRSLQSFKVSAWNYSPVSIQDKIEYEIEWVLPDYNDRHMVMYTETPWTLPEPTHRRN